MQQVKSIPFTDISSIPKLIKDFLKDQIADFKECRFSLENIEKRMQFRNATFSSEQRFILYEVLARQSEGLSLSTSQIQNLERLKATNTLTITTGHQLNLFSGPVFFIYKILQTIKTAVYLAEKFPQVSFVPIFWMATEDHDFEEINHFRTTSGYYETQSISAGAVGKIRLKDQHFLEAFEEEFKDTMYGTELIFWMREAYQKGHSLAMATRKLVHRLFSDYGLLILDGDHPKLKRQMYPFFEEELLHQRLLEKTQNKINWLSKAYGKVQVNPREINLFYLSENSRNRIERRGEGFGIVNEAREFSQSEILEELERFPERFSPNALMRPVYQEYVLPNLVYVGGNAEIMYWLELQDYFGYLGLEIPILIPRNSFLYIHEKVWKKMKKLDLEIHDFFRDFSKVQEEKIIQAKELQGIIAQSEQNLQNVFFKIKAEAYRTDKTFLNLVEAEETRQLKAFARMKKRLLRAEKIKHKEKLQRMETLFLEVHPCGNWQERVLNFSVFYSDYGREWLQTCYENMNVINSELNIIRI